MTTQDKLVTTGCAVFAGIGLIMALYASRKRWQRRKAPTWTMNQRNTGETPRSSWKAKIAIGWSAFGFGLAGLGFYWFVRYISSF